MCRRYTTWALAAIAAAGAWLTPASAQTAPNWKHVGGTRVNRGFGGPAAGPVESVWYGPGSASLLAQTASGRVFETSDFEHWKLSSSGAAPARTTASGARSYRVSPDNIFASDDAGRTWINLTGFNNRSVIGDGFTSVAVSPGNQQEISASNRYGVWRSLDGGMTWQSLNEDLPALAVRRLADRRTIVLEDGTVLNLNVGVWTPSSDPAPAPPAYNSSPKTASPVERFWVDADQPDVALAAAAGHLYRTINGGMFWDDVTGSMPASEIHGLAADRSAGVVYLATERGVYSGSISLTDAGPVNPNWKSISADLPAAPAWDVRLNVDNSLTVALDGYGVFETPAPHHTRNVRIVNGADLSDRAAAPGSLISVLGARVDKVDEGYPVVAASDQSSQLQVPFEASAGRLSLTLQTASGQWSAPIVIKRAAPSIFVDSEGAPLILDASSGLVLDSNLAVHAGSTIQLLVTGLGQVSPEWPTGVPAPLENPPVVTAPVSAFLDGTPVKVNRATLAPGYVGYYTVELEIPAIVNRGASELRLVMNGEESNRVKLYLEPDLIR